MSALTVRSTERPLAEINITPLIDVMLALLLIFMIAAPLVTKTIPLPLGGRDSAAQPRTVELGIAADGQVMFNDQALQSVEVQAQLLSWAGQKEKPLLQLRPDKATPHQYLIDVLALARQSGMESIAIETPR
ncbi:ExbD/TolR family protein [Tahibacter harae]|uniref:Biopolymer transporter ExbD n=1 Tax=Tahibacter harae TaxID=2963937 RepID=A0ABT1QXM8_9GAMM|nr:biopolymer transporter ExbD [Tahibacter harae]MCQ4167037.1 biopolymer transporter ExbD [Tahibacter harae]